MPNLKDLKVRISSVKSTQKITKAMKMVAASKLRKAQQSAEDAEPYAKKIDKIISNIIENSAGDLDGVSKLLYGRASNVQNTAQEPELIILITSDRGLCGSLNTQAVKNVKMLISQNSAEGKQSKLIIVGKKGREVLANPLSQIVVNVPLEVEKDGYGFDAARKVADVAIEMFESSQIGSCKIVYNSFISAISQKVGRFTLFPLNDREVKANAEGEKIADKQGFKVQGEHESEASVKEAHLPYDYEPNQQEVLNTLIKKDIATQIYNAFLQNQASEHASRMTAMDNATRNAGEMIKKLTLQYNRTRQAAITTELTEIISGAEAV